MNNKFHNDLTETLDFLRQQVSRAAVDSRHDLHQVYLATRGDEYPEVRTVILRSVNWSDTTLVFHTDRRSKKYVDLSQDSRATLLGYSHSKRYQVRLRGSVILNHKNDVAAKGWQRLSAKSRRTYLAFSPGTIMQEAGNGLSDLHNMPDLQIESTEVGFENFVSASLLVNEIEWLLLSPQGHRRALFQFNENRKSPNNQSWLCP